ncbi:hypothetical protein CL614_00605 [archaeon]|nr:hypothetical protein [archaeon]
MVDKSKMKVIAEVIKKDKLKPSDCAYHTWREPLNKEKKPAGSIRILVKKEETDAYCEYICPECEHYESIRQEWKRPFNVKCSKCGFLLRISKLKDQIKKENKAAKKRAEEAKK